MPFDPKLDEAVFDIVSTLPATRKKMFGGTCYLFKGHMMCGVYRECLILRLGEGTAAKALARAGVRPFDVTGRPMTGWVMVDGDAAGGERLEGWLMAAKAFVETLPPKT